MGHLGIDQVIILKFDAALAAISHNFIRDFIYDRLKAIEVYLGRGFAFGHNRGGNIELLKQLGAELGFFAGEVSEIRLRNHRISSTLIRRLLKSSRVNLPRRMLGRRMESKVWSSEAVQVGRRNGFPHRKPESGKCDDTR